MGEHEQTTNNMKNKVGFIPGILGQGGSCLTEFLLGGATWYMGVSAVPAGSVRRGGRL
jgi:hypothetical protein